MIRYEPENVRDDFKTHFNVEVKDLTVEQLYVLANLCRHVRGRARNNAALINYFSSCFGNRFRLKTLRIT